MTSVFKQKESSGETLLYVFMQKVQVKHDKVYMVQCISNVRRFYETPQSCVDVTLHQSSVETNPAVKQINPKFVLFEYLSEKNVVSLSHLYL